MPQNPDPTILTGNNIALILGGIAAVFTALGIPKLVENCRAIRGMKYSKIVATLEATTVELADVKRDLYATKDELKKVRTIVSVVLPMMKLKNQNDPETMELIRIFERETGTNLTPAGPNPAKN